MFSLEQIEKQYEQVNIPIIPDPKSLKVWLQAVSFFIPSDFETLGLPRLFTENS